VRTLPLKPNHKRIAAYHESLAEFEKLGVKHESALRSAFQGLLEDCTSLVNKGREDKWKLVPEFSLKTKSGAKITPDGVLLDSFRLVHGVWEAKDTSDDLDKEIKAKFKLGYPKTNILFQAPERAVLIQDGERVLDVDLTKPLNLADVLKQFFGYQPPEFDQWEKAVVEFKERLPEIGKTLTEIIRREEKRNPAFAKAFDQFLTLCQQSLNPNLRKEAVEEMLIQHLLTERIFRKIFDVGEFMQNNNIAIELEKVVKTLTGQHFSRDRFLNELNRFYKAIEDAAATIPNFFEKQRFLNTTYENFFQGFAVARADTLGTVYTPQEIVDFMLASVEEILRKEFGRELGDKNVHVIDPFVGTGNFMVNLIRRLPKTQLEYKYREELHCNEVMLLPYYVATMNIEHTFLEQIGKYEPFPGICFVDTFETAEKEQHEFPFFNPENTERVKRQKAAPIFVVLGNPPYNANQINENDNNKNRKYEVVDARIRKTYTKDSRATLHNKLSGDPYVKAYRWASDRLGGEGILAYVSNSSFIDEHQFDGMRKHLGSDFHTLYILDLGGNVRKNPKFPGTKHNVFGIKLGVSINVLIRGGRKEARKGIYYSTVPIDWTRGDKLRFLDQSQSLEKIKWTQLTPDKRNTWLTADLREEFSSFAALGISRRRKENISIFRDYSLGVSTNRDATVYGFSPDQVANHVQRFAAAYNGEIDRYVAKRKPKDIDGFVDYTKLKWSRNLKRHFKDLQKLHFKESCLQPCLYRPFAVKWLYLADIAVDEPAQMIAYFPRVHDLDDNILICVSGPGSFRPFHCIAAARPVSLDAVEKTQCFPLFTYDGQEGARRENILLSTMLKFQQHFNDESITRRDIFHYVYAVLHHPEYRACYAANLRRELPRIPFVGEDRKTFHALADLGHKLVDLHVNYHDVAEYKLKRFENPDEKLNWRVEKMRLTKDKRAIIYNEFLTLEGIPSETFNYRLGNRSALEWVMDQYQVSTDKRSGITNDPNREAEPDYIVNLIGKVITVSLETQNLIAQLPPLEIEIA
jgi:predicted helicase